MSKSSSNESDIPSLSHIGFTIERHSSAADGACGAGQDSSGSIPSRAGFLSAALAESSLQATSIDLKSALILLLTRMNKMESNIANVTKTNIHLHERITTQEQDKVSLQPDSSEYEGDDLGEKVRHSSEELPRVKTEIDLTVGEVVRDQVEAMSPGKYSLVADLFNQNSPVPRTSGQLSTHSLSQGVKAVHSTSSKRELDDENNFNVGNEVIEQIVTEKNHPKHMVHQY